MECSLAIFQVYDKLDSKSQLSWIQNSCCPNIQVERSSASKDLRANTDHQAGDCQDVVLQTGSFHLVGHSSSLSACLLPGPVDLDGQRQVPATENCFGHQPGGEMGIRSKQQKDEIRTELIDYCLVNFK